MEQVCWQDLRSHRGTILEQFMELRNFSLWEECTLKKLMETVSHGRNPVLEQGNCVRSPPTEGEGVAKT